MKKYIVGGYCRDKIMGLKPKDRDFVLVNANEKDIEYLYSIGYKKVGADFPVFISPQGEEYALARIERKTSTGYNGFEVSTKGVTLEQDLYRRDLTINAIAYSTTTRGYIDPYNGIDDIKNKVLKHVSDSFKEDPLRVLRVARFYARYSDFTIHESTEIMMKDMISSGEIDHLTKERVYLEFEKAFSDESPSRFLKCLHDLGALKVILPEFKYTNVAMKRIDAISSNCTLQFKQEYIWAVLLEKTDLSKIKNGELQKIRVPVNLIKFAKTINSNFESIKKFRKLQPLEMVELFDKLSVKNNGGEEYVYKLTEYFIHNKEIDREHEDFIIRVFDRYFDVDLEDIEIQKNKGLLVGSEIPKAVQQIRLGNVLKLFE